MLQLLAAFSTSAMGSKPDAPGTDGDTRFDEVNVELPAEQAVISSVAQARITLLLSTAKLKAEGEICQGRWTPSGARVRI